MATTENVLPIDFSLAALKEKKSWVIMKIRRSVCALLNSNGGKLVLTATDATPEKTLNDPDIHRTIEQHFEKVINVFQMCNSFDILTDEYNTITLGIKALPILCTLNTNMYLPTNRQIRMIPAKDHNVIKQVLFERRLAEISEQNFSEFSWRCYCGFRESKTVQFKCLKTEKTEHTDFVERMKKNKFVNYVSGFANASGGQIFYGINDKGIVEGESFSVKEEVDIIIPTKVQQLIQNMKWPKHLSKIERGEQWDIKFIRVKESDDEVTSVIVITVFPCFGGVFTEDPESYYFEECKVKKMNFDLWRSRMSDNNPVQIQQRSHWSSKNSETIYMKLTERLENYRQLGQWKKIENIVEERKRKRLPVNIELVLLFQAVAAYYRQHEFEKAEKHLIEYRGKLDHADDKDIFRVEERYSTSALQRSRGNYQNAWKEIKDGLQLADNAPAGFVNASFYLNAAYILSNLVHDKSFIGVDKNPDKNQKNFKARVQEYVKYAKQLTHMALQHLQHVDDEFEIAKEELKQRISITLALLCLRSSFSSGPCSDIECGCASIPDSDLKVVEAKISESKRSLITLKGTDQLDYNYCRLLLVKSDFYYRNSQCRPEISIRNKNLEKSLKKVRKALELATCKNFEEVKGYCSIRVKKLNDIKGQLKPEQENNNDELTENILEDYCLANNIQEK